MKKKSLALLAAVVLIVGVVAGTTLAWLIDSTTPVTNTFTTSDVEIGLTESENLDLQMVPGKPIAKDPKVTVTANSEKCYVFVKIDKSANYDTYLNNYTLADGWLTDSSLPSNVVYRVVDKNADAAQSFYVLAGSTANPNGEVTVRGSVTKTQMEAAESANPTLTFTAYAVQFDYLDPASVQNAWKLASGN